MGREITIEIVPKLLPFLSRRARYKVAYGGRGSGKSRSVARALLARCMDSTVRVLCAREIQKSMNESVHALLKHEIAALGLGSYFDVLETTIRCRSTGSEIIYSGLRTNITALTSMQGIDICWIEEASTVSAESLDTLVPTIRNDGSEIWITFNPRFDTDAVWIRFVERKPSDCIVIECNYVDNPWFPKVLEMERLDCQRLTPRLYDHIWMGKFKTGIDGGDFEQDWFVRHNGIKPQDTDEWNKYIVVDPTRTKNAGSDNAALAVIGLSHDGNRYVLEMVRDKLNLADRYRELTRMVKSWEPHHVYYKKTTAENDIEAIGLFQERDLYRYKVTPLPESGDKNTRIRRMVPDLEAGRWIFPRNAWRKMWDGEQRDQMSDFLREEVAPFPFADFDDMLDALSGAYDVTEQWPQGTNKTRARDSYLPRSYSMMVPG
jgi:PBSX family phage terminase large subunit